MKYHVILKTSTDSKLLDFVSSEISSHLKWETDYKIKDTRSHTTFPFHSKEFPKVLLFSPTKVNGKTPIDFKYKTKPKVPSPKSVYTQHYCVLTAAHVDADLKTAY